MSWSAFWSGLKRVGGIVKNIAAKAWEFATGPGVKDAYDQVDRLMDVARRQGVLIPRDSAPDFISGIASDRVKNEIDILAKDVHKYKEELDYTKKYMVVQNEFSRLRTSADLIDRSMANIKIHASSLSTHFHNIRNIGGLLDDVNALRSGLKKMISVFNHNMNVIGSRAADEKLVKVEGVDVEIKSGAISMVAAYDAFDRTRQILSDEILELARLAQTHVADLESLRGHAAGLGGSIAGQIVDYIDTKIKPAIDRATHAADALHNELRALPQAARNDDGRLVFEEGAIKFLDHSSLKVEATI